MYKILVADDEAKIRETIYDYLTFKGLDVMLARNGEEAVELAFEEHFDLILLDVMMPGLNGIEACREIRKNSGVPVLFLTALGEESDMLAGFQVGADDYIVKPFPLSVLHAKITTTIARNLGIKEDHTLSLSGIKLDLAAMKVYADGTELAITGKDYQLLYYLMQNKGRVLSRELILNKVWGYDFEGDTRVVDTHIKRIRKQLGKHSACICTKIGAGYYFQEV